MILKFKMIHTGNLLLGESKFSCYRDKVAQNGEEYEVFY